MSVTKRFAAFVVGSALVILAAELGEGLALPGVHSLIPTAEAVVGRPLTPVSVAGVARRTVRRCAVGVYRC
jgi:hypothetical protein